ncbi:MAG: CBS domain-containing protein [Flavisolibacter sp.]|jgi:predicted transcriptional regulator|nr:CBS domain-containing protein [Flavisolibacter sp.]
MLTVQQVLDIKTKPFNVIPSGTLVLDALNLLNTVNLSYLVVMDGDVYKGLFCERDYSRNVILKGRASNSTKVEEVMSYDLPVISTNDTVEYCMNLMNSHKTRYLLAYDENEKFSGVITIHDLLRAVINNREQVFDKDAAQRLIDYEESGKIY